MKRIALCFLAVLLCLLTACGKSEAVQQAHGLIGAIGTVTLHSGDAISAAEAAVDALSDRERDRLENLPVLEQARKDYDAMTQHEVSLVEEAIAAIGEVNLRSRAAIDSAWEAYDALEEGLQSRVENYDVLVRAEEGYLLAQVADIEDAIRNIGGITLESGEAIKHARAVYDSYGPEIRERVGNLQLLTTAESVYSGLRINYAMSLIASIGEVTPDSREEIETAEVFLAELTEEEQAQVANRHILEQVRQEYARLHARSILRVTDVWCSEQDTAGGVELYFNFVNPSDRTIAAVTFGVTFYNAAGEMVMCQYEQEEVNLNTYEGPFGYGGGLSGTGWFWGDYYNREIHSVELSYLSVEYADGEVVVLTQEELAFVRY